MKYRKFYREKTSSFLILTLLVSSILGNEDDPQATLNTTNENLDTHFNDNGDQVFSSSTISEKVPEPIGMPQPSDPKPHPHQKHKNPNDSIRSHNRSPVYEVVNQPCYSPGCGGYGPQDGIMGNGNRWQPGRNRYGPGPYPKYYEPRRRGGYREFVPPAPGYGPVAPGYGPPAPGYGPPAPGYGPNYGPQYPDYGYGPRSGYPRERFGGYGRPPYDDYFLG